LLICEKVYDTAEHVTNLHAVDLIPDVTQNQAGTKPERIGTTPSANEPRDAMSQLRRHGG
jgi:hypothetical protein